MPRSGLRPARVFRRRRRVAVPTEIDGPGGGPEGGGLAGVREPRRPSPAAPNTRAAVPLPEDEGLR